MDLFDWMNERHAIWKRRAAGKPWPWTEDEILRTYKFTNVFRELDRVTLELHKRVDKLPAAAMKLYHIVAFRAFNRPETYDALMEDASLYNFKAMIKTLRGMIKRGEHVFTGAYIVTNAGSKVPKIELMASALAVILHRIDELHDDIIEDGTMQGATRLLAEFPMHGNFTSYEVVCDLRWQKSMGLSRAPDRLTWANLGPGARRGINRMRTGRFNEKAFGDTQSYIEYMRDLLAEAPSRLDQKTFADAPALEMREIEHSLCEYDKYMRVLKGEGRPRSVYRADTK